MSTRVGDPAERLVPALHWTARGEPETLRARALSVTLRVADVAKSIDWYRQVLGFTVHRVHERDGGLLAATLLAGSVRVLLEEDGAAPGPERPAAPPVRIWLTTTQDIDRLATSFEERGGVLQAGLVELSPGTRAISVIDPDGFVVTIAQTFE